MCVCLSRVFIAAHFPHQVVAGVITGQYGDFQFQQIESADLFQAICIIMVFLTK